MRFVLTNLGSMGNVQPFIAFAKELRAAKHDPILALAPQYCSYVQSLGLTFVPVGDDIDYKSLQREDMIGSARGASAFDLFQHALAIFARMLPTMFEQLASVCRRADVIVSGHLQPVSRMLHELSRIPFVSVHTSHFGRMQPQSFRDAACRIINPFRQHLGLSEIKDPLHTDANSDQLALYAMSRYLRLPSGYWPPHYYITGFFFLDRDDFNPCDELASFLRRGQQSPVVFTFSSIAHEHPEILTDLLVGAIKRLQRPAIVLSGWSHVGRGNPLPELIYSDDFIPHSWLFPRAACVVHAGGSGTTAATLKAGVPTVVIPHIGDQPIWAELVRAAGCAKYVVPYGELTSERLAYAIDRSISDSTLRRNAERMAHNIRAEEGVKKARLLTESMLAATGITAEAILTH